MPTNIVMDGRSAGCTELHSAGDDLSFNTDDPPTHRTHATCFVFVIDQGDMLNTMNGCFLVNHYSWRRLGERGYQPCFETLEEHATVSRTCFSYRVTRAE